MLSLANDPRTAASYDAAVSRAQQDPQVGVPPASGPPAELLLTTLAPDETVHWLSWAYELREGPAVWWLVALTAGHRLVGVGSGDQSPSNWAAAAGSWTVSSVDGDCVLQMGAGAPLRIRGSGGDAHLFDAAPAPTAAEGGQAGGVVGSWQEAEALAAWHMKQLGFDDAQLTAAGADGGLDVVANSAVAQVKHYAGSPIGAPAVQQLRGAGVGVDWALFYALSGYTRAATDFADTANVALFTYDTAGTVEPASAAARHLAERAGFNEAPSIDEFALQREASRMGQQLFNTTWQNYLATAKQVLAHAQPNSPQTRALNAETESVKRVIAYADERGTMKLPEFMVIIDQIEAARKRLEEHLPWQQAGGMPPHSR